MVLAVASAGWVFDVYEGQFFTIFKTPMLTELTGGDPAAIDWAGEPRPRGLSARRRGRADFSSACSAIDTAGSGSWPYTILVYSIFSALTAFAQSPLQVLVLRFLVALGTGGEWAVAAALVAETFPAHSRAAASGIFHASSVLGTRTRIADRHDLRRPGHVAMGVPRGIGPVTPGPVDSARHSRTRALGEGGEISRRASRTTTPSRSTSPIGFLAEAGRARAGRSARALRRRALAVAGTPGAGTGHGGAGDLLGHLRLEPRAGRPDRSANGVSQAERQRMGSRAYLLMNFTGGLLGLLSFRAAGLMARPAIRVRRLSHRGRDRRTG